MKFILTIILCIAGFFTLNAQTENIEYTGIKNEKKIPKLTLAREDSEGNIIENAEIFLPTDIPIICYVDLNSSDPAEVKLNFIAVKVKGIRPNSKIISISYQTKNKENAVTFTGKPDKKWILGTYRVDIYINGKAALSKEFEVKNSRKTEEELHKTNSKQP